MQKVTFSPSIVFSEENPTRYVREDELEIFFSTRGKFFGKSVSIVTGKGRGCLNSGKLEKVKGLFTEAYLSHKPYFP